MADQLLIHLIKQAQAKRDEDVKIIVTATGEHAPIYKGYIDIEKSSDTQVALKKIDAEQRSDGPQDGPTYRFVVSSIRHVAYAGEYKGEPLHWFILEGDHSLTGVRISRDEFFELSKRDKSGSGGSWPEDFDFDEKRAHVYLKAVRFDREVRSEDIILDLDEINCCGDRG
jgi:hypothetical protein